VLDVALAQARPVHHPARACGKPASRRTRAVRFALHCSLRFSFLFSLPFAVQRRAPGATLNSAILYHL
jgi:hypothetical protein